MFCPIGVSIFFFLGPTCDTIRPGQLLRCTRLATHKRPRLESNPRSWTATAKGAILPKVRLQLLPSIKRMQTEREGERARALVHQAVAGVEDD